jgi:hypothetical protein
MAFRLEVNLFALSLAAFVPFFQYSASLNQKQRISALR